MISKLNDRRRLKHPRLIEDKLPMLQRVDVALDEEQVRAALDGQEAPARHVDPMRVLEVLDGSTSGGLELDDRLAVVRRLGVDDDVELEALVLHDALESCIRREGQSGSDQMELEYSELTFQVDPQVVGVEDLELADYDVVGEIGAIKNFWLGRGYVLDLKSSTCSDGTWAISRRRIEPS